MMTRLAIAFGMLLCSSVAFADRSTTGPDFVGAGPPRHIDRSLVTSPDGTSAIEPTGVVGFEHDRAVLTQAEIAQVDTAARWLKDHPKHLLVLEGHTDATGSALYNEDLATRRMVAVRDHLMAKGIPANRIMFIAFGEREARSVSDPLHGADRRVVMYATRLSPPVVAAVMRTNRPAITAAWVAHRR